MSEKKEALGVTMRAGQDDVENLSEYQRKRTSVKVAERKRGSMRHEHERHF